jgi:hypothetical protein
VLGSGARALALIHRMRRRIIVIPASIVERSAYERGLHCGKAFLSDFDLLSPWAFSGSAVILTSSCPRTSEPNPTVNLVASLRYNHPPELLRFRGQLVPSLVLESDVESAR